MKCIHDELIQKFVDKETSLQEETYINKHISECLTCSQRVEQYKESVNNIKKLIGLLDEKDVEIPEFKETLVQDKIIYPRFKKFIYSASVACILILFLIIFQKQDDKIEITYSYDLASDYNANLPVSEQDMVIQIFDSEGKITTY